MAGFYEIGQETGNDWWKNYNKSQGTGVDSKIFGGWGKEGGPIDKALGYQTADKNGNIVKHGGVVGPAISAFNAYTSWTQGNKAAELAEDQFEFSKDKFWNNYLMKQDSYNRQVNKDNLWRAQDNARIAGGGQAAVNTVNRDPYYTGSAVVNPSGVKEQTVGSAAPSKYSRGGVAPQAAPAQGGQAQRGVVPKSAVPAAAKPVKKLQ